VNRAADSGEVLRVHVDEVCVDHRQHLRQHLKHCHLAAEGGEHRCELHSNHASADDGKPLRHILQLEDLVGVDRVLGAFQRDARDGRAGGDHDVLGLDDVVADRHRAFAREPRGTAKCRDAPRLQQALDALHQLVDDSSLPLLRHRPVESDRVGDEAELGAALGQAVQLG
jgi:hypothetical protein